DVGRVPGPDDVAGPVALVVIGLELVTELRPRAHHHDGGRLGPHEPLPVAAADLRGDAGEDSMTSRSMPHAPLEPGRDIIERRIAPYRRRWPRQQQPVLTPPDIERPRGAAPRRRQRIAARVAPSAGPECLIDKLQLRRR